MTSEHSGQYSGHGGGVATDGLRGDDGDAALGRRLGFGSSVAQDPAQAATEAVSGALAGRVPGPEDLVLVFPTIDYDPHPFLDAASEAAGAAQVVGCTAHAGFVAGAFHRAGVVATYLPAAGLRFGVAAVDSIGDDIFAATQGVTELACERAGGEGEYSALLVLSDGLAGDQREVVRGSYSVTGALVALVGGASADDASCVVTYQFAEGKVMTNGLVAVWINSPSPLGVGVEHGWHPIGELLSVTRAEGNIIHELDGQPAVDMYLSQRGVDLLPSAPTERPETSFARATYDHPLGLATATGRFDVRHILGRTDEGALVMFGHVSEQSVVQVMSGDWVDLVDAAGRAASEATAQLSTPCRGGLVFSCTGRVPALGEHVAEEAAAVARAMDGAPVGGFFTFGEFARVTGSTGFHNATVVVLAL